MRSACFTIFNDDYDEAEKEKEKNRQNTLKLLWNRQMQFFLHSLISHSLKEIFTSWIMHVCLALWITTNMTIKSYGICIVASPLKLCSSNNNSGNVGLLRNFRLIFIKHYSPHYFHRLSRANSTRESKLMCLLFFGNKVKMTIVNLNWLWENKIFETFFNIKINSLVIPGLFLAFDRENISKEQKIRMIQ